MSRSEYAVRRSVNTLPHTNAARAYGWCSPTMTRAASRGSSWSMTDHPDGCLPPQYIDFRNRPGPRHCRFRQDRRTPGRWAAPLAGRADSGVWYASRPGAGPQLLPGVPARRGSRRSQWRRSPAGSKASVSDMVKPWTVPG